MQPKSSRETRSISALKSPWIIAWIGLVVTVLGVNALMVYLAVSTNPGLVVDDYYERGQNYERTMLSQRARNPGWILSADVPTQVSAGVSTAIRLFVVDQAGRPVTPDSAELFLYRPSDAERDFSVEMLPEAAGRFAAKLSFPLVGAWDILIAARQGRDEYHLGQRIMVQRP